MLNLFKADKRKNEELKLNKNKKTLINIILLTIILGGILMDSESAKRNKMNNLYPKPELKIEIPDNAKVTLSSKSNKYYLGENILVDFKLENTGGPAFKANFGSDYRGASRSLRYKVTAVDDKGNKVEDPYPGAICFGGLGSDFEVSPEKPFIKSLPILRYLDIKKAGTYTINITHDFGWKENSQKKYPVGIIKLHLIPDFDIIN